MKNKIATIILSAILIICIGSNIYQYKTTSNLTNSLSLLTNTKNELTTEIESKTEELSNISSETEQANPTISDLTAEKDTLTTSIKETQLKIDTIQQEINQYQSDKTVADKTTVTTSTDNSGSTGNTDSTGTTDSNPVSNDVLPGENADWSGGNGDATSNFQSKFQGTSDGWDQGDFSGLEGIHAE